LVAASLKKNAAGEPEPPEPVGAGRVPGLRARLTGLARAGATYGGAQMLVQAINLALGLYIVRSLGTAEFALYTLCNAMLGMMSLLADGGVASAVMAQGGKVWRERTRLGAVVATGLSLRRQLSLASMLIALPILGYLLHQHGAAGLEAALLIAVVLFGFALALSGTLWNVAPSLHQRIADISRIHLVQASLRGLAVIASIWALPAAAAVMAASSLAQLWANLRMRRLSAAVADVEQPLDRTVRSDMLTVVRRTLPVAVYHSFSSQITVWLISFLGTTTALAQVGALGRISQILMILPILLNGIVVPRFARLGAAPGALLGLYFGLLGGLAALGVLATAAVALLPSQVLWLLGPTYADLEAELVLAVAGAALALVSGAAYVLSSARGWFLPPSIAVASGVVGQVAAVLVLDVSSVAGALAMPIIASVPPLLVFVVYFVVKCRAARLESGGRSGG
jgi:O-antigen/teichoic acid export membrane protein